jgi:hypothetical protein
MTGQIELHPTGLHPSSLAAGVLDFMNQTRLGLLGLAAAADVAAADCRRNHWVLTEVKKAGLSKERWIRSLEEEEANDDRCRAAMSAFAAGGSHEALCSELAAVAAFLNNRPL